MPLDTVSRVAIDLDEPNRIPSRGPSWLGLVAAVVGSVVLTTIVATYSAQQRPTNPPAPLPHSVRLEVAGDGQADYAAASLAGRLEQISSGQQIAITAPGVVVLTVRAHAGQAWCRIHVDDEVTVEQAAADGSSATCVWWAK